VPRLSRWFIGAALAHLVGGFTLGALMLSLKALREPGAMLRLLGPHMDLLLVGWAMQLTMGVAFWILPRFEGGVSRGATGWAWLAFVLVNAGVALVALGAWTGGAPLKLGRGAEASAALAFAVHAWARVKRPSV
jgi:hypothetical protein